MNTINHIFPVLSITLIISFASGALHAQELRVNPLMQKNTNYNPLFYSTGTFHANRPDSCPPAGDGGDGYFNILKNRDIPPPQYRSYLIGDLINELPQNLPTKRFRSLWNDESKIIASRWESVGASVEGRLMKVKREGPEACNCHSRTNLELHLWFVSEMNSKPSDAIIAVISPRVSFIKHPTWNLENLLRVVRQAMKVRIGGWLMWNQTHPEQVGISRATLWEIHPIHKIEVLSGGKWKEL